MLQSLGLSLKGLKSKNKSNLWSEALLFHHLKTFRETKFIELFPDFTNEITCLETFYKLNPEVLEVTFSSDNLGFLTVLKTNISKIQTELYKYLESSNQIPENKTLTLIFRRK
jgi:hypothetical protein